MECKAELFPFNHDATSRKKCCSLKIAKILITPSRLRKNTQRHCKIFNNASSSAEITPPTSSRCSGELEECGGRLGEVTIMAFSTTELWKLLKFSLRKDGLVIEVTGLLGDSDCRITSLHFSYLRRRRVLYVFSSRCTEVTHFY
jgi:hypothetical protein